MSFTDRSLPLVAVVTPVYNGADYLEKALDCIQSQTYPNLVHVVRDNASTDATPAIIERYKNRRVPIVTERGSETVPLQKNWNAAVALVPREAKYFQILCADDEVNADAVAKMVAVAELDDAIELVGCMHRLNEKVMPSGLPSDVSVFDGRQVVASYLNKKSNDIPHMFGLFRRREEDFQSDFFDCSIWSSDSDACLRAMTRGKFGFVHECLCMVRMHEGQVTSTIVNANKAMVFEPLIAIERWGPAIMGKAEYQACLDRHLRTIYRYMLAWRALGKMDVYRRHVELLARRDKAPGMLDFAHSVIEWPFQAAAKRTRAFLAGAKPPAASRA